MTFVSSMDTISGGSRIATVHKYVYNCQHLTEDKMLYQKLPLSLALASVFALGGCSSTCVVPKTPPGMVPQFSTSPSSLCPQVSFKPRQDPPHIEPCPHCIDLGDDVIYIPTEWYLFVP